MIIITKSTVIGNEKTAPKQHSKHLWINFKHQQNIAKFSLCIYIYIYSDYIDHALCYYIFYSV